MSSTAFTYNEGTFVGAANLLGYTNEAMLASKFTMNRLCDNGILPVYGENGEAPRRLQRNLRPLDCAVHVQRGAQPIFESWLQKNAEAAWNVRRASDGLSWCNWQAPTPPGRGVRGAASSSVVMLQVVRPAEDKR